MWISPSLASVAPHGLARNHTCTAYSQFAMEILKVQLKDFWEGSLLILSLSPCLQSYSVSRSEREEVQFQALAGFKG